MIVDRDCRLGEFSLSIIEWDYAMKVSKFNKNFREQ